METKPSSHLMKFSYSKKFNVFEFGIFIISNGYQLITCFSPNINL